MSELYTALGRVQIHTIDGVKYPLVVAKGRSYPLNAEEMVVWSTLNWRILDMERLETLCRDMGKGYSLEVACADVLQGLVKNGLVALGQGQTDLAALENLLSGLNIILINQSLRSRVKAFVQVVKTRRVPLFAALRLFERPRVSDKERRILSLCKDGAPLAINSITAKDIIMGREVKDTISAIANLLLHQQILLAE